MVIGDQAASNHGEPVVHGANHRLDLEEAFELLLFCVVYLRMAKAAFVGDGCGHADRAMACDAAAFDGDAECILYLLDRRGFHIGVDEGAGVVDEDVVARGIDHVLEQEDTQSLVLEFLVREAIDGFGDDDACGVQGEEGSDDGRLADADVDNLSGQRRGDELLGLLRQSSLYKGNRVVGPAVDADVGVFVEIDECEPWGFKGQSIGRVVSRSVYKLNSWAALVFHDKKNY